MLREYATDRHVKFTVEKLPNRENELGFIFRVKVEKTELLTDCQDPNMV